MLSVATRRRDRTVSNSDRETKTAVNTFDTRPKNNVGREAPNGPGPELEQESRRDQRRDVRVDNRQQHAVETGGHRRADALCGAHLLLDALEDQDVGVDADADGQDQTRNARQRQHRLDVGHARHQDQQVQRHRHHGIDARQLVVPQHEDGHQHEPGDGRRDPPRESNRRRASDRRSAPPDSVSDAGRAPDRRVICRSSASCWLTPVIWPLSVIRPWMVGAERTCPSRMIARPRPRLAPVMSPILRAPLAVEREAHGRLVEFVE